MPQNWICPKCNAYNPPRRKTCWQCQLDSQKKAQNSGLWQKIPRYGLIIGLFSVFCCLVSLLSFAFPDLQGFLLPQVRSSPVELRWKLTPGEALTYNTIIEAAMGDISLDESIIKAQPGVSDPQAQVKQFEGLINSMRNTKQRGVIDTTLTGNPNGNISIEMVIKEAETQTAGITQPVNDSFLQNSSAMQIEMTPKGKPALNYSGQGSQNLLALLFQLPEKEVKVGDTWPIDFVCITIDPSFSVENSQSENHVTLTGMTESAEGEAIALVDYEMAESLDGKQPMPVFSPEPLATSTKCTGVGHGEFLIKQGRWKKFTFEIRLSTIGIMTTSTNASLSLSLQDKTNPTPASQINTPAP
jgi:hypothetical protein